MTRTDTQTYINDGATEHQSSDKMKLLGFNFSTSTSMGPHVEEIKKKVHRRVWTLINLKRAGVKEKDILTVYYSIIRSVIEYASVIYHSMLTKEQSNALESLQKMCVRVIFGWEESYERTYNSIMSLYNIQSLHERRVLHCIKFAKKCTESDVFSSWFPLNHNKKHNLTVENNFNPMYPWYAKDQLYSILFI